MIKKLKIDRTDTVISRRTRAIILPILIVVGTGAVVLAVLAIIVMPRVNPGAERGYGANGYHAFVEPDGNLGMAKVVSKDDVETILGNKAKVVSNVDVSKVFNLDGTRGQTATYDFVRSDGVKSSLYVDLMFFKNQQTLDDAHVTADTLKAGTINGYSAYYMHALTLGKDREYRLLVVNGLKVYKFVIAQPHRNVQISEVSALAALKKLAAKAHL
jgi:hypothetical protein